MGIATPSELNVAKKLATPDIAMLARRAKLSKKKFEERVALIHGAMAPVRTRFQVAEEGSTRWFIVERRGVGIIDTEFGDFWQFDFEIDDRWGKYSALVKTASELHSEGLRPIFRKDRPLLVRTDSGCETAQVFGDRTCDCREQLALSMKTVQEAGEGIIICIPRQDGRGMGLDFKLATLWLQKELKVNTVEAACLLIPGGEIDIRTYSGAVCILKYFGVPPSLAINLATNNPEKANVFHANGYEVNFQKIVIKPTKATERHLLAKQQDLGHRQLVDAPE